MNEKKCKYCPEKVPESIFKHFGINHCNKNACAKKLYRDNEKKLRKSCWTKDY